MRRGPLEVCWLVLVSGGYYYRVVDGQSSNGYGLSQIVTSLVWTNSLKFPRTEERLLGQRRKGI